MATFVTNLERVNLNNPSRLLLTGFVILLVMNLATLALLLRPPRGETVRTLVSMQHRMDSLTRRLELSRQRIDTVMAGIDSTLVLTRRLDVQVREITAGYESSRTAGRKQLESLRLRLQQENKKLQQLQHELSKL